MFASDSLMNIGYFILYISFTSLTSLDSGSTGSKKRRPNFHFETEEKKCKQNPEKNSQHESYCKGYFYVNPDKTDIC